MFVSSIYFTYASSRSIWRGLWRFCYFQWTNFYTFSCCFGIINELELCRGVNFILRRPTCSLWCYFSTFTFLCTIIILSWMDADISSCFTRKFSFLLPIKIIMAHAAVFPRHLGLATGTRIAFRFTRVRHLMICHYGINWRMRCVNFWTV